MASIRNLVTAAVALGVLGAAAPRPALAQADDYPNREVRFVIGFVAGSGADILVRYFADKFREVSGGKTFLVDNKPGAAGGIAMKAIATAKPDGYTIGLSAGSALYTGRTISSGTAGPRAFMSTNRIADEVSISS